ncbi:MAG TPA: squalene--hopene cyclase [Phycisphaerales bacterium]|nr:squalene--hopene cyclase [Phycisphaerales bacterium]
MTLQIENTLTVYERGRIKAGLDAAIGALVSLQKKDGHWCGELQGDSILESEYLLMKFILGQEREPMADGADGPETLGKIANELRKQQRTDGGWGQYPGSAVDLSATVKGYFALKLMGDSPSAEHMVKARKMVRHMGGAEMCNSFTNFYLACLGQISWNAVPAIPPEIVFLPRWSYFHLTKVAAWTRTMILPLSLVVTLRPERKLTKEQGIDELYIDERDRHRMKNLRKAPPGWAAFFMTADRVLKIAHRFGGTPVRRLATKAAEKWIVERAGQDGAATTAGLGAIFPPMVYLQIAFKALGYERDHEVIKRAERELDEFFIPEGDRIRIQPCFSPVWDTGIALYSLTDAGMSHRDESVSRAADWLLAKECGFTGDWIENLDSERRAKLPGETELKKVGAANAKSGGWYFEYHNAWYPDVDDTAMVTMALRRAGGAMNIEAAARGVQWIFCMQNDDGGWAAFDKTKHRQILEYIPFADHNAMQDPSCPDITGRVLECLSWNGYRVDHPAIAKAVAYIKSHQEKEGCFFGRWGVNYIYGTWQAVIGPIRCGVPTSEEWIRAAGAWIKSVQKEDGSFGESANSYETRSLMGKGPSTASQTAWGAMILQEVYGADDADLKRAIKWLIDTQLTEHAASDRALNPDRDPAGSWAEPWFTGTGFPKVFYLRYHLYRLYFPLMAIGRYLAAHGETRAPERTVKVMPKLQTITAS